jgi:hypothetical protein
MMQTRHDTAANDWLTRTPAMNQDLRNVLITVVRRAVLPTLLLVAAVSFITMPYTLGHHPREAAAARHMI